MAAAGARSHRANDWVVPENLRLMALPGYSPELNPEEYNWDEVREKAFPNLVLDRMELGVEDLQQERRAVAAAAERIRSRTAWPWRVRLNLKAHWN